MLWSFINAFALIFAITHIIRKYLHTKVYKTTDITKEEDVRNKVILITGSNSGIGMQAAYEFASRDANVILACRDPGRASEAVQWIRTKTNMGQLTCMKLDLASLESVRSFAKEFKKNYCKLDILINNGGLSIPPSTQTQKTSDGFEMHMGVNHLGHFLLTNLLLDSLKNGAPSRIVNTCSEVHTFTKLDLDDLMSDKQDNTIPPVRFLPAVSALYCRSKMAQILFNYELSKKLKGSGVNTYGICPGGVASSLGRNTGFFEGLNLRLMNFFFKNLEEGAATILFCALNKELSNQSGEMYRNCGFWEPSKRTAYTDEEAKKLWDVSAKLVNLEKHNILHNFLH